MIRKLGLLLLAFALAHHVSAEESAHARSNAICGALCTYGNAPLQTDQHVDLQQLLSELVDLHANTYRWVLRPGGTNFQDLKKFLPLARAKNLRVWVNVNPPSERPKDLSPEQLRADYMQWAADFAKLSLAETNLVAWSIDDFVWNLKFFTPEFTRKLLATAHEINPNLAFVPCCYFKQVTPQFAEKYGALCDGVMFPYRDESGGANLTNATRVASEVKTVRERLRPSVAVVVSVYASRHSKLGVGTSQYVEDVLREAQKCGDSVSVYRHPRQSEDAEKYAIVKRSFANRAR